MAIAERYLGTAPLDVNKRREFFGLRFSWNQYSQTILRQSQLGVRIVHEYGFIISHFKS